MSAMAFYFLALVITASVACVVVSKSIVRVCMGLLGALLGVAGLFLLMNAELLAAVQILIYAGGTLILIIFGVMLSRDSPLHRIASQRSDLLGAILVCGLILPALILSVVMLGKTSDTPLTHAAAATYPNQTPQGEKDNRTIGKLLVVDYIVPFELAGVLLLVVMIGAAYLARGPILRSAKPAKAEVGRGIE